MIDESKTGTNWQDDELDAIVADYFAMLAAEHAGEKYNKSQHRRTLIGLIGRKPGSIELKHMNLSAALSELGLPIIDGYKPARNFQGAIFGAIDRYLSQHPEAWSIGESRLLSFIQRRAGNTEPDRAPRATMGVASEGAPFTPAHPREVGVVEGEGSKLEPIILVPPPSLGEAQPRPDGLQRLVRKFDPAARDARNRILGRVGEQHIYDREIAGLIEADRMDLAKRVEWTSEERGDGAGYDIRSFDPTSGQERFIEVKTTRGGARTDFFLSRNERAFSDEEPERYRLYRVFDAAADMKLFALRPPLEDAVRLSPETWRARF